MKLKSRMKMTIDIAMSILLFLLMSYQFTGQKNHEIAGAAMLILFVIHHLLNYKWYLSLRKGKYSSQRILLIAADIVLLLDMLILMVSGIGMSRYLFRFLDIPISMAFARSLHMVSSYMGFLLVGFHIGLHYIILNGRVKRLVSNSTENKLRTWILRGLAVTASAYGVYALIKRNFFSYISLKMHYVFFDYREPVIYYELDLIFILILMIFIGYYIQKLMKYTKIR